MDVVLIVGYIWLLGAIATTIDRRLSAAGVASLSSGPTMLLLLAAAVFDLAENGLVVAQLAHYQDSLSWVVACVTALKWLALGVVVVRLVLGVVELRSSYAAQVTASLKGVRHVRTPLLLALVFVVLVSSYDPQAFDVLLRWSPPRAGISNLLLGVGLTAMFSITLVGGCLWLLRDRPWTHDPDPQHPEQQMVDRAVTAIGFALTLLGGVLLLWLKIGRGIVVLGVVLLLIGGASKLLQRGELPVRPIESDVSLLAPLIGCLPLLAIGNGLVRVAVTEDLYAKHYHVSYLVVGALGIGLIASGLRLARVNMTDAMWVKQAARRGSLVVGVVVTSAVFISPIGASGGIGTVGVVAAFLTAVLGVAMLIDVQRPVTLFRRLGMMSTPTVLLLVTWLAFSWVVDRHSGYHDVRLLHAKIGAAPRPSGHGLSLERTFNRWLYANGITCLDHSDGGATPGTCTPQNLGVVTLDQLGVPQPPKPDQDVVPLTLVSAAGGGIRAAYWTAMVFDCLFDASSTEAPECAYDVVGPAGARPPTNSLLFASGTSGGSLGIASFAAHVIDDPERGDASDDWVARQLASDGLAPTVARMLFGDVPDAFLRLHRWDDRSALLERSWEESEPALKDTEFLSLCRTPPVSLPHLPVMLMNGTSALDGCQFNTSIVELAVKLDRTNASIQHEDVVRQDTPLERCLQLPEGTSTLAGTVGATKDLTRYLCAEADLRLSTAALLSARFPYVSSTGRLEPCKGTLGVSTSYVVDGGYYENSGLTPLREAWAAISPWVDAINATRLKLPVVPILIVIDNHYAASPGLPNDPGSAELLAPLNALKAVRDGHDSADQQSLQRTFSEPFPYPDQIGTSSSRFIYFHPATHPGVEAPLGWVLARTSREDLRNQFKTESRDIAAARCWLFGRICHNSVMPLDTVLGRRTEREA